MSALIHIAIIDDDEAVLDSLRLYFARQTSKRHALPLRKNFFLRWRVVNDLIASFRMSGCPACRAWSWFSRLKDGGLLAPVVLITGHGDVDMAVAAIKVGAFDFIEKPFDEARLLASIKNAIEKNQQPEIDAAELEKLRSRFDTLSARQRQVMELAVAGLSNKEIGSQLKISPKTVENHRAWVMERIGARNIADLVRIAMKIQGMPRS